MKNRIDLTETMKEMLRGWKGKLLNSYTENGDDGYVTTVRFLVDGKAFDFDNDYTAYFYSNGEISEFSCFSCVEVGVPQPLQASTVGGKCKENIVGERIENIYIVKDLEREIDLENELVSEFAYQTALVIQTESCCYAFWRHIIFNTIEISVCADIESALKNIKKVEEIQEERQVENPYTVKVERSIEKL